MSSTQFLSTDEIRARFSKAMSDMYRAEVPLYGTLQDLVADVNAEVLYESPASRARLAASGELDRLDAERHGAIRLGTAEELAQMRRIFAVMGMSAVGYYDLSVAGVPVHSTAFRPVDDAALARNPFRVFTSLLRLELIEDDDLRTLAQSLLDKRRIFSPRAIELTQRFETSGGLSSDEANDFVTEVRETFRWHREATVSTGDYARFRIAHPLIADVVCFKGPHINHLTPRTLDIDAAQKLMQQRGLPAKEVIEGPPRRKWPILLRQTSFKALEEPVLFPHGGRCVAGSHTARFGEIEQRGMALTSAGRALYDRLLAQAREDNAPSGRSHDERLADAFADFPDELAAIRQAGLAYFRYSLTEQGAAALHPDDFDLDQAIARGHVKYEPITYEDFLPVSAAGIFQSNLGASHGQHYTAQAEKAAFERALGGAVLDELALYEAAQQRSIDALRRQVEQAVQR